MVTKKNILRYAEEDVVKRAMPDKTAAVDDPLVQHYQDIKKKLKEETILKNMAVTLYAPQTEEEFFEILYQYITELGYSHGMVGFFDEKKEYITVTVLGKKCYSAQYSLEKESIFAQWTENKPFTLENITIADVTPPLTHIIPWLPHVKTSVMGIPLGEPVLGGLAICGDIDAHDRCVLTHVATIAGAALHRMRQCIILDQKVTAFHAMVNQFHLLQQINNTLNAAMDLGEILHILVKGLHEVFGYETPSVYLLNQDKTALLVREFYINPSLVKKVSKLIGVKLKEYEIPLFEESRLKKALDTEIPLITDNIPDVLADFTDKESMKKLAHPLFKLGTVQWLAALPLHAANEPVGMVVVTKKDEIDQKDIKALQGFLQQASLAIKRAELHEQLKESLAQIKEANQIKAQVIDIASHELRTPLTSIHLYLEMIEMGQYGEIPEQVKEKLGVIWKAADRLQDIIDQTLLSSQIIKDKLILKKKDVLISEVIEEVISRLKSMWEQKNQHIMMEVTPAVVAADQDAVAQVVYAVIDNAIKYSGKNTTIAVTVRDNPEEVTIVVADEGIGIPLQYQEKIFEEFFIVPPEKEYARIDGRTGMGLFIAKGIVEKHGGKIWVDSVYGTGSTFYFTLPKMAFQRFFEG